MCILGIYRNLDYETLNLTLIFHIALTFLRRIIDAMNDLMSRQGKAVYPLVRPRPSQCASAMIQ